MYQSRIGTIWQFFNNIKKMDHQDFQKIRKEYEDNGIDIHDLDPLPLRQLELWMDAANSCSPGRWFETNAMALATADENGNVGARYVLLKGIDDDGILFFTNYDSEKGQQLAVNPNCSVALHWPFMGRQIRIQGSATKTSQEVSEKYFHSRPRSAQIGAAVSNQSKQLSSRQELEERVAAYTNEIGDAEVPRPDHWGGYKIHPVRFEFWQGRTSRLHDRIVYQKDGKNWSKFRLAP